MSPDAAFANRWRWALVQVPATEARERHALPLGMPDAEAAICGFPRPGEWSVAGFTARPSEIGCEVCRAYAAAIVSGAMGPG